MSLGTKVIVTKQRRGGFKVNTIAEIVEKSTMLDVHVFRIKSNNSFAWVSPDYIKEI